jgi:hypothetical protein
MSFPRGHQPPRVAPLKTAADFLAQIARQTICEADRIVTKDVGRTLSNCGLGKNPLPSSNEGEC